MAITFTPGQTVATPDWEALFQQHGGSKSTVLRPMTKAEETAALDAGEDPTQNPIYRYYAADGSYVEARKAPNGDYQVVGYQPSEKFQQAQQAATPTATAGRTAREEAEIKANAALPPDQDPRSETNAERAARADARIKQQGADAQAADERARRDRIDQANSTRADSAEARAAAAAGQPDIRTETVTKNGQTYTRQITTPKGGGTPTIKTFGPDGKELPGGIPGDKQIHPNAPKFVPDWQKPGLGLIEYASAVRADPLLDDEQKAKLITEAHTLSSATIAQGNAVLSAQQTEASRRTSERGQDAGMANQRLSASSSNFATAARQAAEDTKYSEGPQAASVLPYYLAMAQAAGQAYGGFNTPPPVQPGAAIGQMQQQGIPGLGSMLPGSFTPGAPAGAPSAVAAPDQAAPGGMPAPIFAPQPVAPPPAPAMSAPAMSAAPGAAPAPAPQTPTPVLPIYDQGGAYNPGRASATGLPPGADNPMAPPASPLPPPIPPPDGGGQYAPQLANPGFGATGDGSPVYSPPLPAVLPHEMQPPMPVEPAYLPQSMAPQQGGGMAALLGNVGPWAGQPQQPQGPSGQGALLMQRAAGGYDPSGLNRMLLEAGLDPSVLQNFGGVG